jgi:hypothetical protein
MTQLTQEQPKGHLSEDAANAFLAALPEYISSASKQTLTREDFQFGQF